MTRRSLRQLRQFTLSASAILFLAACGGGNGSAGAPPRTPAPPPPPSTGINWTSGVFAAAGTFKNRCETVRTGVDLEGNPFLDQAGSIAEENFWLRSWTHETYLWNDEVTDRNPNQFNDPVAYFDLLKTTATTPSGKPKDDFHFSIPTVEFLQQRNAAAVASYGATFGIFAATPPRDIRILYTEPNSPASQIVGGMPNFVRGARIIEVDGFDAINASSQAAVDALNAAIFPTNAGEMHTFVVRDPGAASDRTVMLTTTNLADKAVNRTAVLNTPTGPVGYILLNTFGTFASESEIVNAISSMKSAGVTDLVLDLRYNGGGLLAVASQLSYMVAGASRTNGKIFERLRFNADAGSTDPVNGGPNDPTPFFSTGLGFSVPFGTALQSLNLGRVFVLTTEATCSASESVINSLRGINVEVILIGNTTCGKPFGFFPQDNCGETYFTIQFQGVNNVGFGDYADGFVAQNSLSTFGVSTPGCAALDDLSRNLGDPAENLLATALQYRANATCPAPPPATSAAALTANASLDIRGAPNIPRASAMANERDMAMPK